MSLLIDYPFSYDRKNYGLVKDTPSTMTTEYVSYGTNGGVFGGGCAHAYADKRIVSYYNPPVQSINWTVAMWLKFPQSQSSSTAWQTIFIFPAIVGENSTSCHFQWADYHQMKIFDGNADTQKFWFNAPYYDKWFHITITHSSDNKLKYYINGVLQGTANTVGMKLAAGNIYIGHTNVLTDCGGFYYNQVRIYDECLSQYAIRELSLGLSTHLKLEGLNGGNTNLFSYAHTRYLTSMWSYHVISTVAGSTQTPVLNPDGSVTFYGAGDSGNSQCYMENSAGTQRVKNIKEGQYYTLSVKIRSVGATTFKLYWYDYNSSGGRIGGAFAQAFNFQGGEERVISYTRQLQAGTVSCYFELNMFLSATGTQCIMYPNSLKLEPGQKATPYTPPLDEFGSVTTYEYDCSGTGTLRTYNQWTSAPETITPSPRNQAASVFSGNQCVVSNISFQGRQNLTFAAWVYLTSYTSDRSCLAIGGEYFTVQDNGKLSSYAYGKSPAGYHTANTVIPLNTWTHVAIVWDDTSVRYYYNGNPDGSVSTSGTFSYGNAFQLGREGSSRQLNGAMSDFRIYATALSDADIKRLYEVSASVSKDGELYAYDICES